MTALTGVALLTIALAGCERSALGLINAQNGTQYGETISNPVIGGCHHFRQGVARVENHTLNDIILYQTDDCTEPSFGESSYVGTTLAANVVRSTGLWRSYTIVGR
ncbi:hypothetical protein ACWD4J_16645 [Streptomyces sp. NPDC002577]